MTETCRDEADRKGYPLMAGRPARGALTQGGGVRFESATVVQRPTLLHGTRFGDA